jgi:hypothetical protein
MSEQVPFVSTLAELMLRNDDRAAWMPDGETFVVCDDLFRDASFSVDPLNFYPLLKQHGFNYSHSDVDGETWIHHSAGAFTRRAIADGTMTTDAFKNVVGGPFSDVSARGLNPRPLYDYAVCAALRDWLTSEEL